MRSDGVVERTSSPSLASGLLPGDTVPVGISALISVDGHPDRIVGRHDVMICDEPWRCVVQPVAVGPTVLLLRRLGDESPEATTLIDYGLTQRQAEVALALATTGATNSQLARSLEMSEGTVKKHLEIVFRTLHVESRAEAVVAVRALLHPWNQTEP